MENRKSSIDNRSLTYEIDDCVVRIFLIGVIEAHVHFEESFLMRLSVLDEGLYVYALVRCIHSMYFSERAKRTILRLNIEIKSFCSLSNSWNCVVCKRLSCRSAFYFGSKLFVLQS